MENLVTKCDRPVKVLLIIIHVVKQATRLSVSQSVSQLVIKIMVHIVRQSLLEGIIHVSFSWSYFRVFAA